MPETLVDHGYYTAGVDRVLDTRLDRDTILVQFSSKILSPVSEQSRNITVLIQINSTAKWRSL
jgi:hypothetical protein